MVLLIMFCVKNRVARWVEHVQIAPAQVTGRAWTSAKKILQNRIGQVEFESCRRSFLIIDGSEPVGSGTIGRCVNSP
jgi:hypothetical protein